MPGPLDATVNFAKATVSTGYAAGVTSITLAAGGGARFPTPDFNAVWWNATDFADPADDPTVEIVRVTNIAGDVLTIVRGQEGTADVNHNTAGKTYKLIEGITSSQMDIISEAFAVTAQNLVWASPDGSAGPPSFRALTAADIGAAGNEGDVQFNRGGVLGASAGLFNWDETDKLLQIGGGPISPFPGLYAGVDENTMPSYIQGWTTGRQAIISDGSGGELNALNVLWSGGGNGAISAVSYGANGGNDGALNVDAIGTIDGGVTNVIDAAAGADGAVILSSAAVLLILDAFLSGGAAITDNYGVRVHDLVNGTNNLPWKSGAGMVVVGDPTKAAGIHVQGVGTFDVDGFGTKAQLWLDADNNSPFGLVLTNQVAGSGIYSALSVNNSGNFFIDADVDNSDGNLKYDVTSIQWSFNKSLQVKDWISTLRNTAPADGEIAANECALWFDPTNLSGKFMLKAKTADGTVVTGSVPLV